MYMCARDAVTMTETHGNKHVYDVKSQDLTN